MVGKWLVHHDPRRVPPVVDPAVAVASAAPAEPSVLLVSAVESILNLKALIDSLQHVWSVLRHGADSVVAAPFAKCFAGFEQEYLQNELNDEFQLLQTSTQNRHGNTFISLLKNLTTTNKQAKNN